MTETKPKDGIIEKHDEKKGFLVKRSTLKDGKLEGACQTFYPNGKVEKDMNFKSAKLDGSYKAYDDDGHIELEQTYKMGVLEGPSKMYKKGVIFVESNYVDGLQDGMTTIYYPNGKDVNATTQMKAGKKHGEMKVYAPNGTMTKKSFYQIDLLQEDSFAYFPDTGAVAIHEKYKDDKLQGDTIKYFPNGVIAEIATFDQGKPVRKSRKFKPNGAEAA